MNRDFQFDEDAVPTTSTGAFIMASISPTWSVGDRYLIIATAAVGCDVAVDVALQIDGATVYDHYIQPRDTTNDMYSCPMIFPFTVAFGTEILDFLIDPDAGTFVGATGRQSGIYVFKLTETDQTNADYLSAGSSTSSTSFTTVTGSTVTIAEDGEYLVLASATVGKGETTANFNIRLSLNGAALNADQTMRATSTTKFFPWATMIKVSLVAGDVLTIEHKVTTTGTVSTNYASIVALRADDLAGLRETEDSSDFSVALGGAGLWVDNTNLNRAFDLPAFPSLILSCGQYRRGAASFDASVRTLYDGAAIHESRNESVVANGEAVHFGAKAVTPSPSPGGAHAITQQLRNEGGGITSAFLGDAAVAILSLADNATVRTRGRVQDLGQTRTGLIP